MKYFNSVFGFMLLIVLPILLVTKYRKNIAQNIEFTGKKVLTFCKSKIFIYALSIASSALLVVIISNMLSGDTKKCVAEVTSSSSLSI